MNENEKVLDDFVKELNIEDLIIDKWVSFSNTAYVTFSLSKRTYCISVNIKAPTKYVFSEEKNNEQSITAFGNNKNRFLNKIKDKLEEVAEKLVN